LKETIAGAKEVWDKAKECLKKCEKEEDVGVKDIADWDQQRGGLLMEEDCFAHAKDVISPALTKYQKLYEGEKGNHIDGKHAIEGCQLFDPFYLATCVMLRLPSFWWRSLSISSALSLLMYSLII
jgi:hypothetical protein